MEEYEFRRSHWDHADRMHSGAGGFAALVLIVFLVTGLVRLCLTGTPPERVAAFEAIHSQRDRLLEAYDARWQEEQVRMADRGDAYGYADAFRFRYDVYPLFDSLARIDVMREMAGVGACMNKARANYDAQMRSGAARLGEQHLAYQEYGVHPMEAAGHVSWSGLLRIPQALANHVGFCMLFMPLLLIGRILVRTRGSGRAVAKALGPYAWWLATCTVLWPVLATQHGEREPKETTRFFWLRLRYMLAQRKLLITVAEKQELLRLAGSADGAVDDVIERVRAVARAATGANRRLAFVSYLLACVTFGGANVLTAPAAYATETVVAPAPATPTLTVSGYAVASLNDDARGTHADLNYFRLKPVFLDGRWSCRAEIAPHSGTVLKYAFVGYDMPELRGISWSVEAGRVIAPWCYAFLPANASPFVETPFDGRLDLPYFDNGVVVRGSYRGVTARFAATNGTGTYADDNGSMDVSSRVSVKTPVGTLSANYQFGQQPAGTRELRSLDLTGSVGPISYFMMGLERPHLEGNGFATSVSVRAGPLDFCGQVEYADVQRERFRGTDIGVNIRLAPRVLLKAHAFFSEESPHLTVQWLQCF